MAVKLGPLTKIVNDFTSAVTQIFGGKTSGNSKGLAVRNDNFDKALFDPKLGGAGVTNFSDLADKWIGNAGTNKGKVRYGFAILNVEKVLQRSIPENNIYYLDIPPQAINQKEIFASNIQATRKGIIVESEGVVFKDIIIQGTTGIYPGIRGSSNSPQANFGDFTAPPKAPQGVDPKNGRSTGGSSTVSGYEEFVRLRQFFLKYAKEKVESNGNRFFVFINEKDGQSLIVEPLEFEMIRSSKSPMVYNYKIVLKAIGSLDALLFDQLKPGPADILTKISNVAANSAAAIRQARAVIGASNQLLQRTSQVIDQTFIGPLRQLQFALEDLSEGVSTTLSLPAILYRNASQSVLDIRETFGGGSVGSSSVSERSSSSSVSSTNSVASASTVTSSGNGEQAVALASGEFVSAREVSLQIQSDNKVAVPRSFVSNVSAQAKSAQENISDTLNLGSTEYDQIVRRTSTAQPNPLKVASDEELLLLGALQTIQSAVNSVLATNGMFQSDAQTSFDEAAAPFEGNLTLTAPRAVREITLEQGEILERIAQREYGDASRWVDIVVLNNLKPPYISTTRQDGIKIPGDKLLIGVD